jgi:predicted TIM-barrel fold metal-dependent hydrolase
VDELLDNIGDLDADAQQDIAWRNAQRLYRLP